MAIWCDKDTCFAWNAKTRGCAVLNDTNFFGHSCPFFKTRATLDAQQTEAMLRKAKRGCEEANKDEGNET